MMILRRSAAFALARGLTAITTAAGPATTAPAVVVAPPAKETFHVYLLRSQSNMVGRDTRTLEQQVDDPRVLAWSADGNWVVARDPIHPKNGRIEPGVGPGIAFARTMAAADPKVTIGLNPCAVGGTSLDRWVNGADLYEAAVLRAKSAQQAGTLAGVVWHQGGSDTTKQASAETHGARLTQMFADLRKDVGRPDLPIVVGQIRDFLEAEKYPFARQVRDGIRNVPNVVPNSACANAAGLGDKVDKLPFSAEAARELGARLARAIQSLKP